TREKARRATLEIPQLAGAVGLADVENDEGVRADKTKFLHCSCQLYRVFLVEHGEGVMRQHGTADRRDRTADEESRKVGFHASLPLEALNWGTPGQLFAPKKQSRKLGPFSYPHPSAQEELGSPPARPPSRYFRVLPKYFRSGGAWSLRDGIK